MPNHLDRSIAVYGPDGGSLGELSAAGWFPNPMDPDAPAHVADIPNEYLREMLGPLCNRPDALSDLLLTIDESLWTVEAGAPRTDQDLAVLVGRPLAVVRAELSLRLRGVTMTRQDWWSTFDITHDNPPQPATAPVGLGTDDGGLGALTWPVRFGDYGLRDDGLIGLFLDAPGDPDTTWGTFRAVTRPGDANHGYVKQIGTGTDKEIADPRLRFLDDLATPDPTNVNEVIRMTMLVDPRASVHAFTGILPVAALKIPHRYTKPALHAMSYLFRAGPILTPPDELRIRAPGRAARQVGVVRPRPRRRGPDRPRRPEREPPRHPAARDRGLAQARRRRPDMTLALDYSVTAVPKEIHASTAGATSVVDVHVSIAPPQGAAVDTVKELTIQFGDESAGGSLNDNPMPSPTPAPDPDLWTYDNTRQWPVLTPLAPVTAPLEFTLRDVIVNETTGRRRRLRHRDAEARPHRHRPDHHAREARGPAGNAVLGHAVDDRPDRRDRDAELDGGADGRRLSLPGALGCHAGS